MHDFTHYSCSLYKPPTTLYDLALFFNLSLNISFAFLPLSDSVMEAFGVLKFWWNSATGASDAGDLPNPAIKPDDDEEIVIEDSFLELVLKSPDSKAKTSFQFVESPGDAFMSKSDISNSKRLYPVTILRSTPKFNVFLLGFGKSTKFESNGEMQGSPVNQLAKSSKFEESDRCSVTCREEKMAGASSLARDNSLRSQLREETSDYENRSEKSARGSVFKYLKLMKPLHLMVWKRQNEKSKFTDSFTPSASPVMAPVNLSPKKFSESSRIGSFKIVASRLGKSRSASAAVGVSPTPARRIDDSLLERHDGIQSAVLYCKKSYNSSSKECSQLFKSSIDPSHHRRNSCEEAKRCII